MTPKTLIYDFDRSTASIGSDEKIQDVFGYRPRRFASTKGAFDFFTKLHTMVSIKPDVESDPLGLLEEEKMFNPNMPIDIEVLDSITAFQRAKKKEVKGTKEVKKMPKITMLSISQ